MLLVEAHEFPSANSKLKLIAGDGIPSRVLLGGMTPARHVGARYEICDSMKALRRELSERGSSIRRSSDEKSEAYVHLHTAVCGGRGVAAVRNAVSLNNVHTGLTILVGPALYVALPIVSLHRPRYELIRCSAASE